MVARFNRFRSTWVHRERYDPYDLERHQTVFQLPFQPQNLLPLRGGGPPWQTGMGSEERREQELVQVLRQKRMVMDAKTRVRLLAIQTGGIRLRSSNLRSDGHEGLLPNAGLLEEDGTGPVG